MATVIWVDSDVDDADDLIEIIEAPTPRKPLAGPSALANTPRPREKRKRQRAYSLDSEIEFVEVTAKVAKVHKAVPQAEDHGHDDHAIALALQKKWEEEDELARKHATESDKKSLRLIERLQDMDQKMAEKRQKLAQSKDVPDDGIVFRVVIDAEGNTIEGDDDPDNAAHLDLVKRDFEQALAAGLKVKTVQWFVNAKVEARFEKAKELLNSLGIDATEKNLFHGTAERNIQPIVQDGFKIPGVTPGVAMAHGAACGVGVYLATNPQTSLGYTQGASRMFMCRVITGRNTPTVSHAIPPPLGQPNGFESWTQPGGGVYVVKYVDLVVPRYVVEFEMNAALQNYGGIGMGLMGMGMGAAAALPLPMPALGGLFRGAALAPPLMGGGMFGLAAAAPGPAVPPPALFGAGLLAVPSSSCPTSTSAAQTQTRARKTPSADY
ncbi:ADP-ribosylation [Mycena venus]|uniref:ADP-ribosylation n=1 Tax=Mycena venus TaxID=2733690 RepID=A0A8H7CEY2_9AGAR|nr:ADP-ribosylation [Mycena venus]